jgi:hypothetical protein
LATPSHDDSVNAAARPAADNRAAAVFKDDVCSVALARQLTATERCLLQRCEL